MNEAILDYKIITYKQQKKYFELTCISSWQQLEKGQTIFWVALLRL